MEIENAKVKTKVSRVRHSFDDSLTLSLFFLLYTISTSLSDVTDTTILMLKKIARRTARPRTRMMAPLSGRVGWPVEGAEMFHLHHSRLTCSACRV